MDRYIGTKIVLAEPASEFTPDDIRGSGRAGYKVVYEDGYTSWSPKETFERAYRNITPEEAGLVVTGKNPNEASRKRP